VKFLRALGTSINVQGRNILLFADSCVTHLQDIPFPWKVKFVYYPPNQSVLPSPWTGYAWMLRMMLT